MTTFRCDENGDLWFNDWNRGSDDFAREQMEKQAAWFAECIAGVGDAPLYISVRKQWLRECREALQAYDAYWLEDDEQLRYETETGTAP